MATISTPMTSRSTSRAGARKKAAGNSMARRMGALIDDKTGKLRDGVVTRWTIIRCACNWQLPTFRSFPAFRIIRSDRPPRLRQIRRKSHRQSVGTGPFELVSYEVGQKAVFKRARRAPGGAARAISMASSSSTTGRIRRLWSVPSSRAKSTATTRRPATWSR